MTPNDGTAGRDPSRRRLGCRPAGLTMPAGGSHPTDARVAEALHRVVRATRFGCTTDTSPDTSREAFTWLHKLFRQSEWAKQTPYWSADRGVRPRDPSAAS